MLVSLIHRSVFSGFYPSVYKFAQLLSLSPCISLHACKHTHNSLIISASYSCCKLPCTAISCLHDSFQLVQQFLIVTVSDPFKNLIKAMGLFPGDMHKTKHTHTHTHTNFYIKFHLVQGPLRGDSSMLINTPSSTPLLGTLENYTSLWFEVSVFDQWNESGSDVCGSLKSLYSMCNAFSFDSATVSAALQIVTALSAWVLEGEGSRPALWPTCSRQTEWVRNPSD